MITVVAQAGGVLELVSEWPGNHGTTNLYGVIYRMHLDGDHVYYDRYTGLVVLDKSPEGQLTPASTLDTGLMSKCLEVSKGYVYMTLSDSNLCIVDARQSEAPKIVYQQSWTNVISAIAVEGTHAFVVSTNLQVVDVTDPAQLRVLGEGPCAGGVSAITLHEGKAYLVGSLGLEIQDIADPANPRVLGSLALENNRQAILLPGPEGRSLAMVGQNVVDVTNPAEPRLLNTNPDLGLNGYAINGNFLYKPCASKGVNIYDISNPVQPVLVRTLKGMAYAGGVVSDDGYILVHDYYFCGTHSDTLRLYRVENGSQPEPVGVWTWDRVYNWIIHGSYAYAIHGSALMSAFSLEDPARPRAAANLSSGPVIRRIVSCGNHLLTSTFSATTLTPFDISNPANPTLVKTNGPGATVSVSVFCCSGPYIYASRNADLVVYDASNPTNGFPLKASLNWGTCTFMTAADSRLYTAGAKGLSVFSLENPTNPVPLVSASLPSYYGSNLVAKGDYIYVPGSELRVFHLDNNTNLTQVATYGTNVLNVTLQGQTLFLAKGTEGIEMLNVSIPDQPRLMASSKEFAATIVVPYGDYVYALGPSLDVGIFKHDNGTIRLAAPVARQGQDLRLSLAGPELYHVVIQRSTDATTWQDWQTATFTNSVLEIADPDAAQESQSFYRVRVP